MIYGDAHKEERSVARNGGRPKRRQRNLTRYQKSAIFGLFLRSLYQCVSDAALPLR
jgi:hypothetical protein